MLMIFFSVHLSILKAAILKVQSLQKKIHHHHHHHHQFLTPAILQRWVRMNDLRCPRSFVKSIAPLNVSPIDVVSSLSLSIHCSLGLPLFLFPSNLAVTCKILCIVWNLVSCHSFYMFKPPESSLDNF